MTKKIISYGVINSEMVQKRQLMDGVALLT